MAAKPNHKTVVPENLLTWQELKPHIRKIIDKAKVYDAGFGYWNNSTTSKGVRELRFTIRDLISRPATQALLDNTQAEITPLLNELPENSWKFCTYNSRVYKLNETTWVAEPVIINGKHQYHNYLKNNILKIYYRSHPYHKA